MFQQIMGYDSGIGYTSYGEGVDFPAYFVNWHMAAAFANEITQRHNNIHGTSLEECYNCSGSEVNVTCYVTDSPYQCTGYVLPTDAEWEYAARSGTTSEFWTGDGSELGGTYSIDSCTASVRIRDGLSNPYLSDYAWFCGNSASTSHEVALKFPNGFGLYDMHGNVWEWTGDLSGCSYPQSYTNPHCISGSSRVARGGYWNSNPDSMMVSRRGDGSLTSRYSNVGFRIGIHP